MVKIEVVYGTAEQQLLQQLEVPKGTTAREAVYQSQIKQQFPDADIEHAPLGIFGKHIKDDTILRDHDRVEVYRPLLIDPKDARRKRVNHQAKTKK